ncbi:ERGIC-53 protein [Pelomyxa schiedti]|nr:ERGIC-53 protein [Pelomyxa schiedti]
MRVDTCPVFVVATVFATLIHVVYGVVETPLSVHSFDVSLWSASGDASIYDKYVRLVPDRQSKRGSFWNMQPVDLADWQVEFSFRIHGVSPTGADGLAFWYADEPAVPGTLFGNKELFNGLGVVVDTYDNDGKGIHPYIFGLVNDGTHKFSERDHDHRDHTDPSYKTTTDMNDTGELNGCTVKLRNQAMPSLLQITYLKKTLSVNYKLTANAEWKQCFTVEDLTLAPGGFFGFSAATGDLADNHDIYDITTRSFTDEPEKPLGCVDATKLRSDMSKLQHNIQADLAIYVDPLHSTIRKTQESLDVLVDQVKDMVTSLGGVVPTTGTPLPSTPTNLNSLDATAKTVLSQLTSQSNSLKEATREAVDAARKTLKELQSISKKSSSGGGGSVLNFFLGLALFFSAIYAVYLFYRLRRERSKKRF